MGNIRFVGGPITAGWLVNAPMGPRGATVGAVANRRVDGAGIWGEPPAARGAPCGGEPTENHRQAPGRDMRRAASIEHTVPLSRRHRSPDANRARWGWRPQRVGRPTQPVTAGDPSFRPPKPPISPKIEKYRPSRRIGPSSVARRTHTAGATPPVISATVAALHLEFSFPAAHFGSPIAAIPRLDAYIAASGGGIGGAVCIRHL